MQLKKCNSNISHAIEWGTMLIFIKEILIDIKRKVNLMVKYLLLIWLQFSRTDGIIIVLDELALVSDAECSDFDEQSFGGQEIYNK
jgi:hypothetical protein